MAQNVKQILVTEVDSTKDIFIFSRDLICACDDHIKATASALSPNCEPCLSNKQSLFLVSSGHCTKVTHTAVDTSSA